MFSSENQNTVQKRDELPSTVLESLRATYDVGDWITCKRTPKGSSNISFFVTTSSGKYVLRCSNSRKTIESIQSEVQLIGFLREKGYPAPEIVTTKTGDGYVENNGSLYLMARFISGDPYDTDNVNHLLETGRSLATYHQVVKTYKDLNFSRPSPSFISLGAKNIDSLREFDRLSKNFLTSEEVKELEGVYSYITDQFEMISRETAKIYESLSKVIIQGSFGRSAIIFDGDKIIGVVDFDRATYDVLGIDLAYTIKAFCRILDKNSKDFGVGLDYTRCGLFMKAYQKIAQLKEEEINTLPIIFSGQRLMKIANKCNNFIRKNAISRQELKDVQKLVTMAKREAIRLRWLEENSNDLLTALTNYN